MKVIHMADGEDGQNKGKMSVQEAGRKGGKAVFEKYGPAYMSQIGKKGGESRSGNNNGSSQ